MLHVSRLRFNKTGRLDKHYLTIQPSRLRCSPHNNLSEFTLYWKTCYFFIKNVCSLKAWLKNWTENVTKRVWRFLTTELILCQSIRRQTQKGKFYRKKIWVKLLLTKFRPIVFFRTPWWFSDNFGRHKSGTFAWNFIDSNILWRLLWGLDNFFEVLLQTQLTFTCSKPTIKHQKKMVKYVQSQQTTKTTESPADFIDDSKHISYFF